MSENEKNYAFAGKILRINLSNGEIYTEPTEKYAVGWLGGPGIAIKILYDELQEWVRPFDPANKVIFGTGVLQGTVAPGACKMTVNTLSPVTGGWGTSASDSYVGGQIKFSGYDLVVVSGKARRPVYIWIKDDHVELRDATHLWGKTTGETLDMIREELGDSTLHTASIGPAGENLVRGGCVIQDRGRGFGRCGTGAVMGSKNLKALVAKGSGRIRIADQERFMRVVRELRSRVPKARVTPGLQKVGTLGILMPKQDCCGIMYKNAQEVKLPDEMAEAIQPVKTIEKYKIGRKSFPGCPIGCGQVVHFHDGKFKGLTTEINQWEVIGTLQGRLAVWEPQFMFAINHYCNQQGVDVDFVGGTLGWAYECSQRGILTEKDTDGDKLEWGNVDQIMNWARKISYREGFGDLLAEGCRKAAETVGRGSGYYCLHIKGQELYEPCRGSMAWALGTTTSTRGGGHTTGAPVLETVGGLDPEKMQRVYHIEPGDENPLGYKGKPKMVRIVESIQRAANCLGVCHFNTAWFDLDFMSLPEMAELVSAATGWHVTEEDLFRITQKQLNLEKAFNIRHAGFGRKDDMPTPRDLNEPIPTGKLAGWKIDIEKWNRMLDEYYEIHGWDWKTGNPRRETLEELGIGYVADDLERIEKLR
jgi:aldehyde:ferredoxin oxidoreductase